MTDSTDKSSRGEMFVAGLLIGLAVGAVAMTLFGPGLKEKRAFCDRSLASATASDSLMLMRKPFYCLVS
jgi:hypothetical protein